MACLKVCGEEIRTDARWKGLSRALTFGVGTREGKGKGGRGAEAPGATRSLLLLRCLSSHAPQDVTRTPFSAGLRIEQQPSVAQPCGSLSPDLVGLYSQLEPELS